MWDTFTITSAAMSWRMRRSVQCSVRQLSKEKKSDHLGIMAPSFGHFMRTVAQIPRDALSQPNENSQNMKRSPGKEMCLEIANAVNTERILFMHIFSPKQVFRISSGGLWPNLSILLLGCRPLVRTQQIWKHFCRCNLGQQRKEKDGQDQPDTQREWLQYKTPGMIHQ